jgi:hypothetical protein
MAAPTISATEQLRVAHGELGRLSGDLAELATSISRALEAGDDVAEAMGTVRDMEASLREVYHALAAVTVDRRLRDDPRLSMQSGAQLTYRGLEANGLRVANVSGEFRHHLKLRALLPDGFVAVVDGGATETFTLRRETSGDGP